MKKWNIVIAVIGMILSGIVFFITREAIIETPNWAIFDLDYSGKEKVISSYGALLSAIISSFSVFLLVYTILLQNKEAVNQETRFEKGFKLQKKQFKAEKKREERKEKQNLFYKLQLVDVFLETVIRHIEETGTELKKFIEKEKTNPLNMNMLYFLVNKNIGKLIEMDNLSIFKGFQEFFKEDKDWVKKFSKLFSSLGFYKDALEELRTNFDYHKIDKFNRKNKIAEDLKTIANDAVTILDKYKRKYPETYLNFPFVILINRFIPTYYAILDKDNEKGRETDLDSLSKNLLYTFINESLTIRAKDGFDDLGSEELVSNISSIRKDIAKLKFDCLFFANDCEKRYTDFFALESKHLVELKNLKKFINDGLKAVDNDNL